MPADSAGFNLCTERSTDYGGSTCCLLVSTAHQLFLLGPRSMFISFPLDDVSSFPAYVAQPRIDKCYLHVYRLRSGTQSTNPIGNSQLYTWKAAADGHNYWAVRRALDLVSARMSGAMDSNGTDDFITDPPEFHECYIICHSGSEHITISFGFRALVAVWGTR